MGNYSYFNPINIPYGNCLNKSDQFHRNPIPGTDTYGNGKDPNCIPSLNPTLYPPQTMNDIVNIGVDNINKLNTNFFKSNDTPFNTRSGSYNKNSFSNTQLPYGTNEYIKNSKKNMQNIAKKGLKKCKRFAQVKSFILIFFQNEKTFSDDKKWFNQSGVTTKILRYSVIVFKYELVVRLVWSRSKKKNHYLGATLVFH